MSPDVIDNIAWSLGGLTVGYVFGYLTRRSVDPSTVHGAHEQPTQPTRRPEQSPHWWRRGRVVLGVTILLLVALSTFRYYQVTECQAGYLEAVQNALYLRSEAAGVESMAQIELLTAQGSGDPTERREAVARYILAIQELERVRAANPLPAPDSCGTADPTDTPS